jgi:serine/threonine protein kinase
VTGERIVALRSTMAERPDGVIAGRYRLAGLLGSGGSASVFEAQDLVSDASVALKILHPHLSDSEATRTAFLAEAEVAATVHHANIVAVLASGQQATGDHPIAWIAFERAPGMTLAEHVLANGPLPLASALAVVSGILLATEAAHLTGLVHRDVAPGNVMVAADERGRIDVNTVRLIDFGLSAVAGRSAVAGTLGGSAEARPEKSRGVLGSVHFMSPEQALGSPVDERGDIYQAGAVLFFALTGRPPFPRDSASAVMRAHIQAPPPVPSVLQPGVPRSVDRIVVTAMHKTPSDRFSSSADMQSAVLDAMTETVATPEFDRTRRIGPVPAVHDVTTLYRKPRLRVTGTATSLTSIDSSPPGARVSVVRRHSGAWWGAAGIAAVIAIAWVLAAGGAPRSSVAGIRPIVSTPVPAPSAPQASPSSRPIVAPPTAVAVPDATAMTLTDARIAVLNAGLVVGEVGTMDGPRAAGSVVAMSPQPGSSVPHGSAVSITVASGSNAVPRVVGLSPADAVILLASAGFLPSLVFQTETEHRAGTVLGSDPQENSVITVGRPVDVIVAMQPAPEVTQTSSPSPTSGVRP